MSNDTENQGYTIEYEEPIEPPKKPGRPKKMIIEELDDRPVNYYSQTNLPLREIFVDPGYELEMVSPFELELLEHLKNRFSMRLYEPIPFYDLKAAIYNIGNNKNKRIPSFHITRMLRNLWRAGYIRRFVIGHSRKTNRVGRGEWHGIHYILQK